MSKDLTIRVSCIIDEEFKAELRELIREVLQEDKYDPMENLKKKIEDSKHNPNNGGV